MRLLAFIGLILYILIIVLPFKSQGETIQARIRFITKAVSLFRHNKSVAYIAKNLHDCA